MQVVRKIGSNSLSDSLPGFVRQLACGLILILMLPGCGPTKTGDGKSNDQKLAGEGTAGEKANTDTAENQTKDNQNNGSITKQEDATPDKSGEEIARKTETSGLTTVDSEERQQQAKQLILDCASHYRGLRSYEDEAVFRLSIPYPKKTQEELIPCRIAFEKPNRLALRIDRLHSSWTHDTFESKWAVNDIDVEKQRLVRPLPSEIHSDWLLKDHLSQQVLHPFFGMPVSLEFLLADSAHQGFLKEMKARWLSPQSIDGVTCERIQLTSKDVSWVYWIDSPNKLLLRQEFPHAVFVGRVEPIPAGVRSSDIICQIDYKNIRTNHRIDWSPWGMDRSQDDILVRRFVMTPDRNLHRSLGVKLDAFSLKDVDGREIFDLAERKKQITAFHFVDDSDISRLYIDDIQAVKRQLGERGFGDSYESILVSSQSPDRMAVVMKSWNCFLPLAIDPTNTLWNQCGLSEVPATVVVGKDGRIQHISEKSFLGALARDIPPLSKGVDIANRDIKVVLDNDARHTSLFHRHVLNREELNKLSEDKQNVPAFPFLFHDMELDWRVKLEDGVVAATGEGFQTGLKDETIQASSVFGNKERSTRVMTILDDTGKVFGFDQSGVKTLIATIPVENTVNAKRFTIYPDPWNHEYIYVIPEGLPRFWHFVAPKSIAPTWKAMEADQYSLEVGETIVCATWCIAADKPAFCLVTNQSRILALDPTAQASEVAVPADKKRPRLLGVIPKLSKRNSLEAWVAIREGGELQYIESNKSDGRLPPLTGLSFLPEAGNWLWGKGPDGPKLVGLAKLPSAETGIVILDQDYQSQWTIAMATRPEQCRLLSSMTMENDAFYFLTTAPNRVLHLSTIGGKAPDQMSFGRRVFGGAILPNQDSIKMIVTLDGEVSCWNVTVKE